jgi:4-amino-4-deoxy-L-arabinose transferase-like glycosyltransferase
MVEESKNLEGVIENKFEKIKSWLKDPYNLAIVGIVIFAFALRLYYFFITKNQTLWWDEAEYLATAKHWAFGVPYDLNPQRPPLFQLLGAVTFLFGLGETFVKFAWVLLPSVFLVFVVYLLGKEMFSKKVGLIASFLTAVSWTFLFWTARVQPDFFSMGFQVLSVLFMWKYWKNDKSKYIVFAGIFAALGFYFKISALLVPMSFIIFILIKDRLSAFKNKNYYYFSLVYLATLVPYFIWSYITFGTFTAFKAGTSNQIIAHVPFGWYNLNFFYTLTEGILFVLFLIGLLLAFRFVLYADILVKDKKKCFDSGLFSIIVLMVVAAFYIFYIRGTEDRWVFLWLPFIFMLIGNALMSVYNFGKKYSKIISAFLVIALLIWGGYAQLSHANDIITNKKDSYSQVKDAALWIKEHSAPGDKVLSISSTQTVYYSERKVLPYSAIKNASDFDSYIKENKPRFLMISIFENHPTWAYTWPNGNNSRAVQAYFSDSDKKQPVLIIYEINYNETN